MVAIGSYIIFWVLLASTGSLGNMREKLKCFPIPEIIVESPTALAAEMTLSTIKLKNAFTNLDWTSLVVMTRWEEMGCIVMAMVGGNNNTNVTRFKLREVVRDVFLANLEKYRKNQDLLRFIEYVGMVEGYGFLVEDIQTFSRRMFTPREGGLYYSSIYLLEMAWFFQMSGTDQTREHRMQNLPLPLRLVMSSSNNAPVHLQNNVTGSYLAIGNDSSLVLSKEKGVKWKFVRDSEASSVVYSDNVLTPLYIQLRTAEGHTRASLSVPAKTVLKEGLATDAAVNLDLFVPLLTSEMMVVLISEQIEPPGPPGTPSLTCLSEDDQAALKVVSYDLKRCASWKTVR